MTRWVLAGGGTGGHVTPALALAEVISERGDVVLFLGSKRGLETRLVPQAGYELISVDSQPIMGRGVRERVAGALGLVSTTRTAWRALARFRPDVVVSVGGYAAVPGMLAAVARRTPVVLLEPNAIPGRANRMAARFARRIFLGFESASGIFPARMADRIRTVGMPLRRALVDAFAGSEPRDTPKPPIHLLIFGGSQGARQINRAMLEAASQLGRGRFAIFHQSGPNDGPALRDAYSAAGIEAEVVEFEPDMPRRYRWADLALCRAGAITVAELTLAGLAAVFVPYPYAADDHQAANARALVEKGAGLLLDGRELETKSVVETLESLAAAPDQIRRMSENAAALAKPEAAQAVVEETFRLIAR